MFKNKISLRNAVLRGLVTLSLQKNYLIVKATAPKKNNDFIVSSIYSVNSCFGEYCLGVRLLDLYMLLAKVL